MDTKRSFVRKPFRGLVLGGMLPLLAVAWPASAGLTLTSTGVADGFSLSTVVSGFNGTYALLGEAILPSGNFISGDAVTDQLYIFKDVDGQTLASAISTLPYTPATGNPQYVMATVGGHAYGAQVAGGTIVTFANDGSQTPVAGLSGVSAYYGMWGDPASNHLIASSNLGLIDINPVAGSYSVIAAGVFPDGLTVSPNGNTIYAAVSGNVNAYARATGALTASYSGNGHSPDGTGVISGGALNGDVIVNNNDGTVVLIDPANGTQSIIASGGTRGDFVSPDTSNGTLFLSQTEQVVRLSCGPGCAIGGLPPVPEPSTCIQLIAGLGILVGLRRRRVPSRP